MSVDEHTPKINIKMKPNYILIAMLIAIMFCSCAQPRYYQQDAILNVVYGKPKFVPYGKTTPIRDTVGAKCILITYRKLPR